MALACKNSDADDSPRFDSRSEKTTTKSDGQCSSEAEFRVIITEKHSATYGESSGKFRETEIDFQTLRIGAATRYRNEQYSIDASPAYPVNTDYTVRDYLGGETSSPHIREQSYSAKFICYVDIYDKCVCYDESRKSGESRQTPYKG
jgi:hypothetical protein